MAKPVYKYLLLLIAVFCEVSFSDDFRPGKRELEQAIIDGIDRVECFTFLRDEAKKLGVRVWLFGGTAAGYAHYVKWDVQRIKGDSRFQADRFDYDYSNIYRSTQDLDIVIDGSDSKAVKLEQMMREKFPQVQGTKNAWEFRLLREKRGEKEALLNNPDFLNQHTDSHSTGMVELTRPPKGERVIRDLRDWDSQNPFFLEDVHTGKLHYYFSKQHETTSRFRDGLNPPILSVIRYLTKAFQYELELKSEDLEQIKKVINAFRPKSVEEGSYVSDWIEKNGKKLITHAVNIEYAWNRLEELGLRKKLMQIAPHKEMDTLTWWLGKEPLRSQPVGQGKGKTAAQLGLQSVAHATSDFLAYESITRSHMGAPNVLISRDNYPGESAAMGTGFYTAVGREGGKFTGFTVRFRVNPNAREGTDFFIDKEERAGRRVHEGEYVVFLNKNAIEVIPESLNLTPIEFFHALEHYDDSDWGIIEKLKRRLATQLNNLSPEELKDIMRLIRKKASGTEVNGYQILKAWFSLPVALEHPEVIARDLIGKRKTIPKSTEAALTNLFSDPGWMNSSEITKLTRLTANMNTQDKKPFGDEIAETLVHKDWIDSRSTFNSSEFFNVLHELLEQGFGFGVFRVLLSHKELTKDPRTGKFLNEVLKRTNKWDSQIIELGLHPGWINVLRTNRIFETIFNPPRGSEQQNVARFRQARLHSRSEAYDTFSGVKPTVEHFYWEILPLLPKKEQEKWVNHFIESYPDSHSEFLSIERFRTPDKKSPLTSEQLNLLFDSGHADLRSTEILFSELSEKPVSPKRRGEIYTRLEQIQKRSSTDPYVSNAFLQGAFQLSDRDLRNPRIRNLVDEAIKNYHPVVGAGAAISALSKESLQSDYRYGEWLRSVVLNTKSDQSHLLWHYSWSPKVVTPQILEELMKAKKDELVLPLLARLNKDEKRKGYSDVIRALQRGKDNRPDLLRELWDNWITEEEALPFIRELIQDKHSRAPYTLGVQTGSSIPRVYDLTKSAAPFDLADDILEMARKEDQIHAIKFILADPFWRKTKGGAKFVEKHVEWVVKNLPIYFAFQILSDWGEEKEALRLLQEFVRHLPARNFNEVANSIHHLQELPGWESKLPPEISKLQNMADILSWLEKRVMKSPKFACANTNRRLAKR